jgi:hypothetical protein
MVVNCLHDTAPDRCGPAQVSRRHATIWGTSSPVNEFGIALAGTPRPVHKTPDAASLQKSLGPIKRNIELISRITRNPHEARAWLNSPHAIGDEPAEGHGRSA